MDTTNRPRTRQRIQKPAPRLSVPDINEDAAERKRVLNVLAQRRYRERKRHSRKTTRGPVAPRKANTTGSSNETVQPASPILLADGELDAISSAIVEPKALSVPGDEHSSPSAITGSPTSSRLTEIGLAGVWLPGLEDRPASPDPSTSPQSQQTSSPTKLLDFNTITPAAVFLTPTSPPPTASPSSVSAEGDSSFPDSYLLPVTELTLLRAFMRIGARLGVTNDLFDIHTKSPFNDPTIPLAHLPRTWQPTASQALVPHHPILDFLPWPSVREKIITVLSLPEEMRPVAARSPTALVQFAYDLEDGWEGMRVWGSDPYDPTGWEVGQVLFERWWFIFDRGVVEQSNMWRGMRGAAPLRISEC